ncbi:hypothetical protein EDB83DRAFT_2529347 [Lactarius deliciosus]|nr:hypothetical protein EDB83DRAFT_2529347 [Lactarius deliciosus]
MQPRVPNLVAFTSLVFLTASDLVLAQIRAPDCSASLKWSFNSLGQNMCTIAAFLMSTCNGGAFTINALQPGYSYTGPSSDVDDANPCKCNTVTYNLISACDACQGSMWTTWSEYSFNCTTTLPPSVFPNPVPLGTSVPQWALVDNTVRSPIRIFPKPSLRTLLPQFENLWNATKAYLVGVTPELGPGSLISASTTGSVSPTSSASQSRTSSSSSSGSGSNTAAIAGGVAGGVVVLAAIGAILFYFLRRRWRSQVPSAAVDGTSGDKTHAPGTPMKFYDPNDPSTFPEFQCLQYDEKTLANAQDTRPQGYHGLPTV